MEELEKEVGNILNIFFRDTVGNRLNQWSYSAVRELILKKIRDYKPTKLEKSEDKTKIDDSKVSK